MWKQVKKTNITGVKKYLGELAKQRSHYGTKTKADIAKYMRGKKDIECWMYETNNFSVGAMFLFRPKVLETGSHCLVNTWLTGDIDSQEALEMVAVKAKEYCTKYKASRLFHIQYKDISGDVANWKLTKPFEDDQNYKTIKKHFSSIAIEEEPERFLITLTV